MVIFGLTDHSAFPRKPRNKTGPATKSPHYSHLPSLLPDPIIIQSFSLTSPLPRKQKIWCLSPASDAAANPPSIIIIISSSLLALIRLQLLHRFGDGIGRWPFPVPSVKELTAVGQRGLMPLPDSSLSLPPFFLPPFKRLLSLPVFSIPICFGGGCCCCASFPVPLSSPGVFSCSPLLPLCLVLVPEPLASNEEPALLLLHCSWLLVLSLVPKKGLAFSFAGASKLSCQLFREPEQLSSSSPDKAEPRRPPFSLCTWAAHCSRQQLKVRHPSLLPDAHILRYYFSNVNPA
jgi:hypothetical protein